MRQLAEEDKRRQEAECYLAQMLNICGLLHLVGQGGLSHLGKPGQTWDLTGVCCFRRIHGHFPLANVCLDCELSDMETCLQTIVTKVTGIFAVLENLQSAIPTD